MKHRALRVQFVLSLLATPTDMRHSRLRSAGKVGVHRLLLLVGAFSALLLAAAETAIATTLVLQSIEEMAGRADLVVRAVTKPDSAVSSWDGNHQVILTRTTFVVREVLYGEAALGAEIAVETLGGFIAEDGIGMNVPGSPTFQPGEEVVLFLWRDDAGVLRPIDLAAGKFEVDKAGTEPVVTRRDLRSANIVGREAIAPHTLRELREQVTEGAAEARAARRRREHGAAGAVPPQRSDSADQKRREREESLEDER